MQSRQKQADRVQSRQKQADRVQSRQKQADRVQSRQKQADRVQSRRIPSAVPHAEIMLVDFKPVSEEKILEILKTCQTIM